MVIDETAPGIVMKAGGLAWRRHSPTEVTLLLSRVTDASCAVSARRIEIRPVGERRMFA